MMRLPDASPAEFQSVSQALQMADYLEKLVTAENQWISNRLAWLFTSQTFCIMAYTILVTSNNKRFDDLDTTTLRYGLPMFGITACTCVGLSIAAAGSVARRLINQRARINLYLNEQGPLHLPVLGAAGDLRSQDIRWTYWAGALPRYVLPPALGALWLVLLIK